MCITYIVCCCCSKRSSGPNDVSFFPSQHQRFRQYQLDIQQRPATATCKCECKCKDCMWKCKKSDFCVVLDETERSSPKYIFKMKQRREKREAQRHKEEETQRRKEEEARLHREEEARLHKEKEDRLHKEEEDYLNSDEYSYALKKISIHIMSGHCWNCNRKNCKWIRETALCSDCDGYVQEEKQDELDRIIKALLYKKKERIQKLEADREKRVEKNRKKVGYCPPNGQCCEEGKTRTGHSTYCPRLHAKGGMITMCCGSLGVDCHNPGCPSTIITCNYFW